MRHTEGGPSGAVGLSPASEDFVLSRHEKQRGPRASSCHSLLSNLGTLRVQPGSGVHRLKSLMNRGPLPGFAEAGEARVLKACGSTGTPRVQGEGQAFRSARAAGGRTPGAPHCLPSVPLCALCVSVVNSSKGPAFSPQRLRFSRLGRHVEP